MLKASVPRKGTPLKRPLLLPSTTSLTGPLAKKRRTTGKAVDTRSAAARLQQLVEPVLGEKGTTTIERKLDRAVRRRTAHQQAAIACRAPGGLGSFGSAWQSFLETNRVREPTARRYKQEVDDLREHFPKLALETLAPESLDECVVEYLEHLYFLGDSHSRGDYLFASLSFFLPEGLTFQLKRTRRALKGLRRLAPGTSRAPLPWLAVMAMAGAALHASDWEFAVMLMLQFVCYLRPSELTGLIAGQLVRPRSSSQPWGILLAPQELGRTSKTKQFDESVLVDWKNIAGLRHALERLRTARRDEELLWHTSQAEYSKKFKLYAEMSEVHVLGAHPYSVRHGGASFDALNAKRSLLEIQHRGRWLSEASVRRYNKHARLLKEEERMTPASRAFGRRIEKMIDTLLEKRVSAPAPPQSAGMLPRKLRGRQHS